VAAVETDSAGSALSDFSDLSDCSDPSDLSDFSDLLSSACTYHGVPPEHREYPDSSPPPGWLVVFSS
jgi:hypothetical protein